MKFNISFVVSLVAVTSLLTTSCQQQPNTKNTAKAETVSATDPLPSWNEGPTKQSILDFVTKATTEGSADFVPVADRIACFDNDGTLWSEKPLPFQLYFALDRIKAMAPQHPEWKNKQPFKAILEGDLKTALAGGEKALLDLMMTSACRDDHRRIRQRRKRLDGNGHTSQNRQTLQRNGIPAHARITGLPPGKWLQAIYCFRRRH